MICSICKLNPVKLPMATTCSLECACRLNGDDYNAVAARLLQHVAVAKKKFIPSVIGRPRIEKQV